MHRSGIGPHASCHIRSDLHSSDYQASSMTTVLATDNTIHLLSLIVYTPNLVPREKKMKGFAKSFLICAEHNEC